MATLIVEEMGPTADGGERVINRTVHGVDDNDAHEWIVAWGLRRIRPGVWHRRTPWIDGVTTEETLEVPPDVDSEMDHRARAAR